MPNRLINETSPYLLQHAHNPVDWYPWSEEALERAKAEDKPIIVSIGYAACHWCHVMERESFEDDETAALMNEEFVSIKVDREERPDLDGIYMLAVQAMTGRGGWPLTVFLMPDGRPFYGGTYFPPTDRPGMPSFKRVLSSVVDAYRNRQGDVLANAERLTEEVRRFSTPESSDGPLTETIAGEAYLALASIYDEQDGGFGSAPKFPQSMPMEFLLRFHHRTGEAHALRMVEASLKAMADGGIHDQLGGGFHRYATDKFWLVPHFEKMLYDNALLSQLYLQAYQVTGEAAYRRTVERSFDYLLREMRHPSGGFYSSQDADSEGVEGKYYVWTRAEVEAVLGAEDAEIVCTAYGISGRGNFEGGTILSRTMGATPAANRGATPAAHGGAGDEALRAKLVPLEERLLAARAKRVPPATDDKVLTAWNGLALRALSEAAVVLENDRYRAAAEETGAFLLDHMHGDGRLLRTWKDGRAHLKAYLEDYALLVLGLLALHEATFAHRWLHAARKLTDEMLALFWDAEAGVLYDVGTDHEALLIRPREIFDNAVPSGGSAAAEALVRLGRLTGNDDYTAKAIALLRQAVASMRQQPLGFGNWLKVLELHLAPPMEVAIAGSIGDAGTRALLRELHGRYGPNRVIVGLSPHEPEPFASPVLEGRGLVAGKPAAYVCHGYACELPTSDPRVLAEQLTAT